MIGIGEKLPAFSVVGVKPKFHFHEENGQSAFETLNKASFPGKWKVIFFYPKDFTFVCPTEIAEFGGSPEFADRDAVVSAARPTTRRQARLAPRPQGSAQAADGQFADSNGALPTALASRPTASLSRHRRRRPQQLVQHVYATNLNVGRAPKDTLRVLDALQTDELCACGREVGGATLNAA